MPVTEVSPLAPRLLDVQATAAYLGVSTDKVYQLVTAGKLPRVRLPGVAKILIDRLSLDVAIDGAWSRP